MASKRKPAPRNPSNRQAILPGEAAAMMRIVDAAIAKVEAARAEAAETDGEVVLGIATGELYVPPTTPAEDPEPPTEPAAGG